MKHPSVLFRVLACGLTLGSAAWPSGFAVFQHGGRGAAQAGAMTARADDPSAIHYNPAGLAFLDGLQALAGLDFSAPRDEYRSRVTAGSGGATGADRFAAAHQINPPPALYVSWKPRGGGSRWAFGVGVDAPLWTNVEWLPVAFPLRGENWQTQMLVFELHPVVAYKLNERWSVAGGARYLDGRFKAARETTGPGGPNLDPLAANKVARASGDGFGFDLALMQRAERWGFGASLRSAASIDGGTTIRVGTEGRLPPPGVLTAEQRGPRTLGVELPLELRAGGWYAASPRIRLELDAALARWSAADNRLPWLPACPLSAPCESTAARRWDDTLSLRFGIEGRLTDHWVLSGGLAAEPSPVPASRAEPGFPRGDAVVYAAGASYNFPALSFDLGYSLHDHDPVAQGRGVFSSRDQVFAVAVRWRR